ncbi:MAG: DEAD/DEAH box helicase [Candidatus Micrarchaeota archaeon]
MDFSKMALRPSLVRALLELGFVQPTPVQEQAIPLLLQGKDVIAQAKTGTGKTAAFALWILERLGPEKRVQALVLVPTRELAVQVTRDFQSIGRHTTHYAVAVYGGAGMEPQVNALRGGAQIVVGTPGRILDHISRGTLNLAHVRFLVLDEADRMLDMGFSEPVIEIVGRTPPRDRQSAFFSATMTEDVERLSDRVLTHEPEFVRVSSDSLTVDKVSQYYVSMDALQKMPAASILLKTRKPKTTIIFVRTQRGAEKLFDGLNRRGFNAVALHGGLAQAKRDRSMNAMRQGHAAVLVATDVAARGLDLKDVDLIINYQVPEEAEAYVHRVGRTARAGKSGEAITFVSNLAELRTLRGISQRINAAISELKIDLPKIEARNDTDKFGVPFYLSQGGREGERGGERGARSGGFQRFNRSRYGGGGHGGGRDYRSQSGYGSGPNRGRRSPRR